MAYDLIFTNQTAAGIESYGPLTITSGESFENNNLTLKTYGTGAGIVDRKFSVGTQKTLSADDTTPSVASRNWFISANTVATTITTFDDGTVGQILLIEVNDANTTFDCLGSEATINCGNTDLTGAAGDLFSWIYDGTVWHLINYMESNSTQTGSDLAKLYVSDETLERGDVVSLASTGELKIDKSISSHGSRIIGVISTEPHTVMGTQETLGLQAYPVALVGRVPVKVKANSDSIQIGDLVGASDEAGKAQKVSGGYILGRALEPWTPGQESVLVYVNPIWVDPDVYLTDTGDVAITGDETSGFTVTKVADAISRIGLFSELVAAQGRFGSVDTQQILLNGTDISSHLTPHSSQLTALNTQVASNSAQLTSLEDTVASFSSSFKTDRLGIVVDAPASGSGKLIDTASGAYLSEGGSWVNVSSRDMKENVKELDLSDVLGKIDRLTVTEWNYTAESDSVRHIGPFAEDFYALFGVGEDDKHISPMDAAGIALAGIKALNEKVESLKNEVKLTTNGSVVVPTSPTTDKEEELTKELASLKDRVLSLETDEEAAPVSSSNVQTYEAESEIAEGTIVSLLDETTVASASAGNDRLIMGVSVPTLLTLPTGTTSPETRDQRLTTVITTGTARLNVTNEHGDIKKGDFIAVSLAKEGYGMKAVSDGMVLGVALEDMVASPSALPHETHVTHETHESDEATPSASLTDSVEATDSAIMGDSPEASVSAMLADTIVATDSGSLTDETHGTHETYETHVTHGTVLVKVNILWWTNGAMTNEQGTGNNNLGIDLGFPANSELQTANSVFDELNVLGNTTISDLTVTGKASFV